MTGETARRILPLDFLGPIAALAGALLLAFDALAHAQWLAMAGALVIGVAWVVAQRRGVTLGGWMMAALFVLAAAQMVFGGNHGLLLASGVLGLCAYDLHVFNVRLRHIDVVHRDTIVTTHLRRLALIAGIGLALGEAAVYVRFNLGFGWLVIIALAGVWILGRVVRLIRTVG